MSISISVKDIIELGPGTRYKGKKVLKLAQVVAIFKDCVKAIDLSKSSSILIIPFDQLYEKQELIGRTLLPLEEKELFSMGAKNLWVKLTPKQYEEYKQKNKTQEMEIKQQEFDEKQIEFLRKWLMSAKEETNNEFVFKFPDEPELKENNQEVIIPKARPLSRFLKRKEEQ